MAKFDTENKRSVELYNTLPHHKGAQVRSEKEEKI